MGAVLDLVKHSNHSSAKGRFLIVDDEPSSNLILKSILEGEGLRVEAAMNEETMFDFLGRYSFDAVFLDYKLGDSNGLKLIPRILREYPHCPIIMITAHGSIDLAIDAVKNGFSGFITKPFDEAKVLGEIKKALRTRKETTKLTAGENLTGIIGQSPQIIRIHEQINKMKDVESTVLILGESGTGKELVARALHEQSMRAKERFEAINCAAIPENLLEAELFGCMKGAFTDAKADRKGLFEICNGGTLFLDEIGEMPLHLQSKILRALQEKEITPLGGNKSIRIKTRVVAATNQNLERLVRENKFRKDLYYRLSVLQILVPPLRDRQEDIPLLSDFFMKKLGIQFARKIKPIEADVSIRIATYDWPGNVRELYNSLERAVVLSEDGNIACSDIFSHLDMQCEDSPGINSTNLKTLNEAKDDFEKHYLQRLLDMTRGNVSQASKIAGRMRTDMYRLFSKYGIDPNIFKPK